MSKFQDIRAALTARAKLATGFPTAISYEGVTYVPAPGTPYARLTLMPTSGKPYSLDGSVTGDRGMLQISLFYPSNGGPGTATVESVADAVIKLFPSFLKLTQGSTSVIVDYAQRAQILEEPDWFHLPITVAWRVFSSAT